MFSSVARSCWTLCDPTDCSTPGFPVHHQLCRPIRLLPSIFPSIRVFSNKSALHIRWPKYWHFSFSISPSNEYSGLISFKKIGSPCSSRDSQESFPTPQFKSTDSSMLSLLYGPTLKLYGPNLNLDYSRPKPGPYLRIHAKYFPLFS